MSSRVDVSVIDHVAHVRMIRTDKMNALDPLMFDALAQAGEEVRSRRDVRAIVLSGDGRAFCAGLDLQNFEDMAKGDARLELVERTHGISNFAQHVVMQWREMPVPVITAVHGVAFGGGFQLMLGGDMRFVHPQAKLSIMEIQWGLVPDMAGMWLLRDLLRPDVAADLIYSGRIFEGEEASALGLVTRLCDDPLQEALQVAAEIARKSPDAIRAAKRLLRIENQTEAERVLTAEAVEQAALISQANQIEAVRASQQRRSPVFTD